MKPTDDIKKLEDVFERYGEKEHGSNYKISKIIESKFEDINESYADLSELISDLGKAKILAVISVALDNDLPTSSIRRLIDEAVGCLELDAINAYIEMKNKFGSDIK